MKNLTQCLALAFILFAISACGGGGSDAAKNEVVIATPVVPPSVEKAILTFSNQTNASNLNAVHGHDVRQYLSMPMMYSAGVAVADYDNDGDLDLYFVSGNDGDNYLYQNQGDGTFTDMANFSGVDQQNKGSGPAFGDFNGDGLLDLFVGGVGGDAAKLYVNQGNDKYLDITESSGLVLPGNNFSGTWTDYDKDGDLDLFVTHWTEERSGYFAYFWKNNGDSTFSDVTFETGIKNTSNADKTLTATFSDINNDGWVDLLLVTDYAQSRLYQNN